MQPQSSQQLAEPLLTDPGLKSGISVRELISTLKKKRRRGMNCRTFAQKPRTRGKSHLCFHLSLYSNQVFVCLCVCLFVFQSFSPYFFLSAVFRLFLSAFIDSPCAMLRQIRFCAGQRKGTGWAICSLHGLGFPFVLLLPSATRRLSHSPCKQYPIMQKQ